MYHIYCQFKNGEKRYMYYWDGLKALWSSEESAKTECELHQSKCKTEVVWGYERVSNVW